MAEITHVLCPVDISEQSRHALEHALAFSRFYRARLTVLHVYSPAWVPVAASGLPGEVPLMPPVRPDDVVEEVRRFCLAQAAGDDTPWTIEVVGGNPAKEIVRYAERNAADLIVLGTHGRGGFEHLLLGSVTEKVIRTAPSPVLTIPPPARPPGAVTYETILCPTDFSEASVRASGYAFALARSAGSHLTLFHAVESLIEYPLPGEAAYFSVPEYHRQLESDAKARLSAAVPADVRASCTVTEIVTSGRAYVEIIRIADEIGAELIVMGVHRGHALDRLFGSTANQVIRHARMPVLTLRP